ncbi:MAG: hypothetical protein L0221_09530 [Chloroflexi bacterium]|nr:hypothetical protein [Chloroflexota bacterium]
MSELLFDFGLRLLKVAIAVVIGVVVYVVFTGPLGAPDSAELAVLSFVAGAAAVLLVEGGIG